MLYIEGTTIKLTRGDTAYIEVPIENDVTGEQYVMDPEDVMIMSLKKDCNDQQCLFRIESKGSNLIKICPEDTSHCGFGRYKYDVQICTADGDIFTVIPTSNFLVLQEVTV